MFDARAIFWVRSSLGRLCVCDFAFYKNARKFKWEDTKKQLSFVLYTGIGRSTAKMLVKCGAEVIALSRTQEDLDSLKKEVG